MDWFVNAFQYEQMLYGGLALAAAGLAVAVVGGVVLSIVHRRINRELDKEYGTIGK